MTLAGSRLRRRNSLLLATVAGCALACCPAPVRATSWIEQAQAELTCTGQADDAERLSLDAPWLPTPLAAAGITAYFRGQPRDLRHAQFRHLTVLAAVGWWADLINDQSLREDVLAQVGALAAQYAVGPNPALFQQVSRCARTRLIDALLEQGEVMAANRVAGDLAATYAAGPPSPPVADWPLLLALREMRLEPRARDGIAALTVRATALAGSPPFASQPERASRMLTAAAQGTLALGQPDQALRLALQAMAVTGKPPSPAAAWGAMPTAYDATLRLGRTADAAALLAQLHPDRPPGTLRDREAAFESLLRLSQAAEAGERFDDMARLQSDGVRRLTDQRGLERLSIPFHRRAFDELAGRRDTNIGTLARVDPAFAADTLATYSGLYDTLLQQAQNQFVGDAREQLFFQSKIDNNLHALTELAPAMPRASAQITDTAFRLAQLRSFGRLTLATVSAELARTNIDPQSRFSVERYFSLATQTAVWLGKLLDTVRIAPGAPPPDGDALWRVFFTLDVFYNETTKEFPRYTAFVRQKAPGVTDLATPRPLPVAQFQRRLRGGEAIVATLVTSRDLYVWAITRDQAVLSRQRIAERDLQDKVTRLRASLTPGPGGALPAFDAAAAYELYRLVFEPVAKTLQGVTDVVWYGHGPLGSIPPAVLVSAAPAKPLLSKPAEFARTPFLVDRYAFAVLADLSLFAWHRDQPQARRRDQRLLGVGAPLLSADEVAGGPRSRSYELAGGLDGKALADLPKLAESVDEMKGLAAVVGESNSTLWLGPDATERKFVGDGLRGFPLLALATHGFLPGEIRNVPEPALLLALEPGSKDRFDGILTSREIAALQLDADLVVLSACNTAGSDGRPRAETFTGLSQAFFTAGTRSLMVSHWPVMSGAAVQLAVATLARGKAQDAPWSRSLQQAAQAARKAGAASAIESHPSFWGPFVIVGDGR